MVRNKSAEFKTGLVVLLGLVILVIGIFLVGGGFEQLRERRSYTAYFTEGAGVSSGAAVLLGGQRAGEVKSVDTVVKARDGEERRLIAVTVNLYADLEVPVDSVFSISKTITSIVTVNITYGKSSQLADSETDFFGVTPDTFEQVVAKAGAILGEAQSGVEEFTALMKDARGKVGDFDVKRIQNRIDTILERVESAVGGVDAIVQSSKQPIADTLDKAKGTMTNTEELTATVKKDWSDKIEPRVEKVLDNAGDAAEKAGEVSEEAGAILREARPGIKTIVQNFADASARVAPIMARLESLGKNLNETVIEIRPDLARTLKNAKSAMGNFEALTEDLKTAPWKLVNKPSGAESDAVHLYNASRLYVEAAGRIADNIEDIDALRRLGVLEDPTKKALIEKAVAMLKSALTDFETHEAGLAKAIESARK